MQNFRQLFVERLQITLLCLCHRLLLSLAFKLTLSRLARPRSGRRRRRRRRQALLQLSHPFLRVLSKMNVTQINLNARLPGGFLHHRAQIIKISLHFL